AQGFSLRPARSDLRDPVDMAGEDVPAEFVADRERALEIDPHSRAPVRERAPPQRLGGGLDFEPPLARLGRRQADAGAGGREKPPALVALVPVGETSARGGSAS